MVSGPRNPGVYLRPKKAPFQEQAISLKSFGKIQKAVAWLMHSPKTRKKSTLLHDTSQEEITKANMEKMFFHSNKDFSFDTKFFNKFSCISTSVFSSFLVQLFPGERESKIN